MRPPRLLTIGLAAAVVLAAAVAGAAPATAWPAPLPVLTLGSTSTAAAVGDAVGAQLATGTFQLTTTPDAPTTTLRW